MKRTLVALLGLVGVMLLGCLAALASTGGSTIGQPHEIGAAPPAPVLWAQARPASAAVSAPGVPLGRTVRLRSINYPNFYLRHRNFLLDLTAISSELDRQDSSFRLVPGLADNRLVSFESVNYPGYFLRHQGGRLKLHQRAGDQLYLDDATYKVVPGLADASWVSFESKNYPGYYIRHRNYEGWVERGSDDLFRKDSTFRFEEVAAAQPPVQPGGSGPMRPAGVTGHGSFSNNANLLIDGQMAAEGSVWNGPQSVFWSGTQTFFVIDLGSAHQVTGLVLQVDNNDDYRVEYSLDGQTYRALVDIKSGYGEIGWGMDTFATIPGHPEYESRMVFNPVQARFIKVFATGGDNSYSIAEVQVMGGATTVVQPVSPTGTACAQETRIYTNGNIAAVYNQPTQPTRFTLGQSTLATHIMHYHWNNARGQVPGTIALRHQDGTLYGPWQATSAPGQGGVPNAYWIARPNVLLKPGTYTAVDSDPATWAQNAQSNGQGMVEVRGCGGVAEQPPVTGGRDYTAIPLQPPVTTASGCDIAGTWRHGGGGETWTFTPLQGGWYAAQERGFGNARGPAVLAGSRLRIDYLTQDSRIGGFYEFTIAPDCMRGDGRWQDSRPAGGSASMVRVGEPPTPPRSSSANLALRKPATQSSTDWGGDPGRAVDGNTDGSYFAASSVSHTNNQPQQWWQVDLGAVYPIQLIRIWNRTDCCAERLSRFHVFVSPTPLPPGGVQAAQQHPGAWSYFFDRTAGRTTEIPVNRSGRYVRIQLAGADYLQLAEVEVFGAGTAALPGPTSPTPGGANWDFETGDLRGWRKTGTAFDFQPTYGDNPTGRQRSQPSQHQGQYWIGGYEKRPRSSDPAGQVQGDGPEGTLTSVPFAISRPAISFLVGGGCDLNTERVELLVDGQVVLRATGKCTESMERMRWDVSRYVGRTGQLRLVDASSGGWGHINFDDVRFE